MIMINETVRLPVAEQEVWDVLSDPHQVVGLIGDAEITAHNEDGSYDGVMTVKFGPMRVRFQARVMLNLDEVARTGTISAQGKDAQGGTRMKTDASFDVLGVDEGTTEVALKGQVELSGKLASQIEGAAGTVVKRMSTEFTDALVMKLAPESAPTESRTLVETLKRVVAAVRTWVLKVFRRPRS